MSQSNTIGKILSSGKKINGNRSIGIGFNLDRTGARTEWDAVFQGRLSFEDAYNGKIKLLEEDAGKLLSYGLKIREKELAKIYGGYWNKLKANEKAAITSAYYNSPKTVGGSTNFCRNMKLYAATGDQRYLAEAIYFTWRTQLNLFGNLGYNCRCYTEEITENLEIVAPASEEQKSLSWFIRFGGGRSIVLR